MCDWWRKRISNLAIGSSLAARELPIIRKALDTGCHPDRQPGHALKARHRSGFRQGSTFHSKSSPCPAGAGGTEIRASVLLGPANERRRDFIGRSRPSDCPFPAIGRHQIAKGLSYRRRRPAVGERHRKVKITGKVLPDSDHYHPWSKLRNTVIGGI